VKVRRTSGCGYETAAFVIGEKYMKGLVQIANPVAGI
jgi:hypothetical protein